MEIGRRIKWYAIKAIEIGAGLLFLAAPTQALWRRLPIWATNKSRSGSGSCVEPSAVRIAVVAHVYYPELLPDVLACWRSAGGGGSSGTVPLHITTVDAQATRVALLLQGYPAVTLHVTSNRGRDIAPFLALLGDGVLDGYDAVLKLHTKRSPHLRTGDLRRRLLFTLLGGNPRQAEQARNLFADPRVGMVGWALSFRRKPSWWMANEARVVALCKHAVPRMDAVPGFFEGSMFWVRPKALAALRSLALAVDDFEPEPSQTDGALHHAVERMFTLSAWAGGYRVCGLSGIMLVPGTQS
jgi:lipopolysaccharide biosynthesis protein